jgi:hypothetical protein
MPRRIGRPGLVGTMARTAVIAGTASAVSGNVARRQQAKAQAAQQQAAVQEPAFESQAQMAEMQTQMEAAQQQAAPAGDDLMTKLKQLADLHAAGVLSDEEFTAAKAKLLA